MREKRSFEFFKGKDRGIWRTKEESELLDANRQIFEFDNLSNLDVHANSDDDKIPNLTSKAQCDRSSLSGSCKTRFSNNKNVLTWVNLTVLWWSLICAQQENDIKLNRHTDK